jgi:diadenosine tetraphosphatase ApaH/serine/threonine PP2A family protein phosphatase
MDCSGCHAKEKASFGDPKLLASLHAVASVAKCEACHGAATLQAVHAIPMSVPPADLMRKYSNEFCLKCHGSYADLATATKDSKVFQTPEGVSLNPHLPPTPAHEQNPSCNSCHKMHASHDPISYCYTCHHEQKLTNCKECH